MNEKEKLTKCTRRQPYKSNLTLKQNQNRLWLIEDYENVVVYYKKGSKNKKFETNLVFLNLKFIL